MWTRRAGILYLVAAGVYLVDRVSKLAAESQLRGRPPIVLIPGVFQLRYTENPGGAFGLFGGLIWLFVLTSVVVVVTIVVASRRLPGTGAAVALGLVLGGSLGNLTDRMVRGPGFSGQVVDFLELRFWPVFNVADAAIVIAVIALLLAGLRRRPADERVTP